MRVYQIIYLQQINKYYDIRETIAPPGYMHLKLLSDDNMSKKMVLYGLCFRNSLWGISINENDCTWYGLYSQKRPVPARDFEPKIPKFRHKNQFFWYLKIVTSQFSKIKKNNFSSTLSVPSFKKIGEPRKKKKIYI